MHIVFLTQPDGDTIAREDILGTLGGRFALQPDGRVLYLHPSDLKQWHVGANEAQFRAAAQAWNTCRQEIAEAQTQNASDKLVELLESNLEQLGVLSGAEDSLWDILLEQTRDELL